MGTKIGRVAGTRIETVGGAETKIGTGRVGAGAPGAESVNEIRTRTGNERSARNAPEALMMAWTKMSASSRSLNVTPVCRLAFWRSSSSKRCSGS